MNNNNIEQKLKKIEDEQFCSSFEAKTLSGIVCNNQLERWVPGFCGIHTENEHEQRYNLVSKFTQEKNVIDIACGSGKGSYIMATEGKATRVTGCDVDEETVRYASIKYAHDRIHHEVKDAEELYFRQKSDILVSFETIEHLNNPRIFLEQVKKNLTEGGTFFVSTPISSRPINKNPYNKYHKIEWGFTEFQKLISEYFIIDVIYVQLYNYKDKNIFIRIIKKILGRNVPMLLSDIVAWDSEKYPPQSMGHKFKGYQIIKCKI